MKTKDTFEVAKEKGLLIDIDNWNTIATLYPDKELRNARIIHSKYKKGIYNNYSVNGYVYFRVTKPITITELQIKNKKWETWMVDDPPHWWSMQNYAINSMGNVLVAGLGLGLVIHELCKNVDVNSITVVEINEDVIELITPLLLTSEYCNIKIIKDDFYNFINETKERFDRVIVDLWTTESLDETLKILNEEVTPLAYYLKKIFPNASIVFHGFRLEL